ncbi:MULTISPECIES: hypothetical protein [unclassified Clostridium]|uniref:hypothetical protein n=1 Tax=unclassified Clostridium TaxID=2614128 RepID=UPI000E8122C3|nr:hypothetical protein [Clostridium sp.]
MRKNALLTCFILIVCAMITGCSSVSKDYSSNISVDNSELIYESKESPNENYVSLEKDKVFFVVQVFQKSDNSIIVNSSSNSQFFDDMQYIIKYDKKISKSDIDIKWLTLMGSEDATKENQIAISDIIISYSGEVISERKINFVKKAIEIVVDTVKN